MTRGVVIEKLYRTFKKRMGTLSLMVSSRDIYGTYAILDRSLMRLLMVGKVTILNKKIMNEKHKRKPLDEQERI